jgi:hypothetical protein
MQTIGRLLVALDDSDLLDTASDAVAASVSTARRFMARAANAVRTGGVHTPNHRWVVCSALAYAYRLFDEPAFLRRIDEWISEGIDIDEDGQYAERSAGIYSAVSSEALLSVALLAGRPELLDPVRRNLEATLLLTQPDGRIETVASRRQDQYDTTCTWVRYFIPYRVLAALDENGHFAGAANDLLRIALSSGVPSPSVESLLGVAMWFAAHPEARLPMPRPLPAIDALPTSRLFHAARLYRLRSPASSLSVFGGRDRPTNGIVGHDTSGRSTNPTVLTFTYKTISIRGLRVLPRFFGTGYLRPTLAPGGDWETGGTDVPLVLREVRSVAYAQPLAPRQRRSDGHYELDSADGRYHSALGLRRRAAGNEQTLAVEIRVTPTVSGADVAIDAEATTEVLIWLELAFDPDAELVESEGEADGARRIRAHSSDAEIQVLVLCDSPASQLPADWDYGDFEIARRSKEERMHRRRPLRHAFVSFAAPGNARLSIRGRG